MRPSELWRRNHDYRRTALIMIPPCGVPVLLPLPPVICRFPRSSCCSTGFQPHLDELEHVVVNDTTRHRLHQLMMRDRIEVLRHVRIHHLSVSSTQQSVHFPNRLLLGTAPRSIAVRARLEIRFEDRLQHQLGRALRHSVLYGWYSKWPLAAARFGYHHSAHRTRLIRLFVQRFSRLGVRHVDNVTTPSSILARRCWYDPQAVREEIRTSGIARLQLPLLDLQSSPRTIAYWVALFRHKQESQLACLQAQAATHTLENSADLRVIQHLLPMNQPAQRRFTTHVETQRLQTVHGTTSLMLDFPTRAPVLLIFRFIPDNWLQKSGAGVQTKTGASRPSCLPN